MRIRPARPEDAPACQGLVQAGFETYRSFAPPGWEPPDERNAAEVARAAEELALPQTFALIAEDDHGPAGTVRVVRSERLSRDGFKPDHHLKHLFVAERLWGSGLAHELHARGVDRFTGTARLFTPARHGRARRFYEREGWRLHDGPFDEPALGLELVEYRLTGRSR